MHDTYSGLLQASPTKYATQKATICGLEQLCVTYRVPTDTDSNQGSHFTGHKVQVGAKAQDVHWHLHLPCNPSAAQLAFWKHHLSTVIQTLNKYIHSNSADTLFSQGPLMSPLEYK